MCVWIYLLNYNKKKANDNIRTVIIVTFFLTRS